MADFTALKTAIQTYIKQNGNEEITGNILQEVLLSVVTTLGDGAINDLITALSNEVNARQQADGTLQQNITNEATARGNADTALQGLIDGITDNIENGYVYAGIATPSSTPATGKVFYLALTAGTYTNFGNTEVSQGINILKYNGSAWSLDTFIGIDDAPTPNSPNLVKSGGAFDSVMTNGSAFDISAHFASGGTLATYADLDAALAALNTLSASYKRGGMSIKFVQSSDNKYVQARLMAQNFTTDVTQWQGVDEYPMALSENLAKSGGIKNDLYRLENFINGIETPSTRTLGYIDANGYWENSENLGHIVVEISSYIGKKITAQKIHNTMQYAFLSSYTVGQRAIFAPNCERENGCPEEITIPEGANYLYVYMQRYDGVPNIYIENLLEEKEIDIYNEIANTNERIENLEHEVRSIEMPLSVTNGYLDANGFWETSNDFHHVVVDISSFIGLKISANESVQYAFLSSYKVGQKATFAPECSRENGTPENLTIPEGANYLYLYIGRSITVPNVYISELVKALESMAVEHETKIKGLENDIENLEHDTNHLYVKKTQSVIDIYEKRITDGYIHYKMTHRTKPFSSERPCYYDNWGIDMVSIAHIVNNNFVEDYNLFRNGEAEIAIRESGEEFVGGALHGFENIIVDNNNRCFSIIINNVYVDEDGTFEGVYESIAIKQKSNLYRYGSTSEIIAVLDKEWIFNKDNGFIMNNRVSFTSNINIVAAYGAMMCVFRRKYGAASGPYITNRAIKNNEYKVFDVSDGWVDADLSTTDVNCTKITEYGELGFGFSMEVLERTEDNTGGMFVTTNGSEYNKIYSTFAKDTTVSSSSKYVMKTKWDIY